MPCNSDHMEPTVREKQWVQATKLLIWYCEKTERAVEPWMRTVAEDIYGRGGEEAMQRLCKYLRTDFASYPAYTDAIVYGRNKESRQLADWWEDHCKEDAKREA